MSEIESGGTKKHGPHTNGASNYRSVTRKSGGFGVLSGRWKALDERGRYVCSILKRLQSPSWRTEILMAMTRQYVNSAWSTALDNLYDA